MQDPRRPPLAPMQTNEQDVKNSIKCINETQLQAVIDEVKVCFYFLYIFIIKNIYLSLFSYQ